MAKHKDESGFTRCTTRSGPQICLDGTPRPYIDPESFEVLEGSYARDRRFGYWRDRIITGCDPATLRYIVDDYAADSKRVYHHGSAGPEDPESFEWLAEGYTKDNNAVYCYGRLVSGADPATATVLSMHYLRDRRAVYHLEHEVSGATPESFTLLDGFYGREGKSIYGHGEVLAAADASTFRVIPSEREELHYAADATHVFRTGEIITDADHKTFEPLAGYYARDARGVYHYGYLIPDADPETLTCIEDGTFARDKSFIYYREHRLAPWVDDFELLTPRDRGYALIGASYYRYSGAIYSTYAGDEPGFHHRIGADPASFRLLGGAFARDATRLFCYGRLISECDPETFEDLGLDYYRDASGVFLAERQLEGADPASFVVDYRGWSRDAKQVWLEADPVSDLSPKGFTIHGDYHVSDKKSVFYYDARLCFLEKLPDADPRSFRVIDETYSRDATRVYYVASVMPGADPESFERLEAGFSKDEHSIYYHDEPIKGADAASFTILTPEIGLDRSNFYFYGTAYPCHAESFTVIDQFFCKDREHVWFEGELLPEVDAPSFEQRTLFFYVDAYRVYERETPLPLDPATVRFLDEAYAVGTDAVYFLNQPLPGADPASFAVLGNNFSKDATHVYFREQPVAGAHAPSFEVLNYLECQDEGRVYAIRGGEVTVSRMRRG
ncbi:MAG: DKNYY domain-containing protein [Spirochaetota bacterium]